MCTALQQGRHDSGIQYQMINWFLSFRFKIQNTGTGECARLPVCGSVDCGLAVAEMQTYRVLSAPDRKVMERGAWSRGRASEMATASELLVLDLEVRPIFRLVAFY